ncbi:E3 ubiquitin protein ligase XBAT32 [Tanacetum coccineum]
MAHTIRSSPSYQSSPTTYHSQAYQSAPTTNPSSSYNPHVTHPTPNIQFSPMPSHSTSNQSSHMTQNSPVNQSTPRTHGSMTNQSAPSSLVLWGHGKNKCYWEETKTQLLIEVLQDMACYPLWKTDGGFRSNYMGELHRRILIRSPNFLKQVSPLIKSKVKWLKTKFHSINDLLKLSGFEWNDVDKNIACEKEVYDNYCNPFFKRSFPKGSGLPRTILSSGSHSNVFRKKGCLNSKYGSDLGLISGACSLPILIFCKDGVDRFTIQNRCEIHRLPLGIGRPLQQIGTSHRPYQLVHVKFGICSWRDSRVDDRSYLLSGGLIVAKRMKLFEILIYGRDRATGAAVEGYGDAIHNMKTDQNVETRGDHLGNFHFSLSDDEENELPYVPQTTTNITNATREPKKQKTMYEGNKAAKKKKKPNIEARLEGIDDSFRMFVQGFNTNFGTMANVVANSMNDDNMCQKATSKKNERCPSRVMIKSSDDIAYCKSEFGKSYRVFQTCAPEAHDKMETEAAIVMEYLSFVGNSFGCSASGERLVSAARDGDFQEAKALLEYNPRLVKYSTFGGRNSPLHHSAAQGHHEIVSLLIESGVDINIRNYRGQTALMQACQYGHWEVVLTLILSKANIHKMDYINGGTAFHVAALNGHSRCIRILLADYIPSISRFYKLIKKRSRIQESVSESSDGNSLYEIINKPADGGVTALHMTALNGHVDSLHLLLDLGASINEITVDDGTTIDLIGAGSTPLHYAAYGGNPHCCQILIARGASLTAENAKGWSPLEVARSWHRDWLEEILSARPQERITTPPSPYLCLPLMSVVKIARECGWTSDSVSNCTDPCAVCLENKCTVAASATPQLNQTGHQARSPAHSAVMALSRLRSLKAQDH